MHKILTILGARPQFVKASAVSSALSNSNRIDERILHTGQHFDVNMSDIFFSELGVPQPVYNLGISGGSHARMTAAMLTGIEEVISEEKPSLLLVYGDTNSTLAGALAASKMGVPIAHIEAGLRSFNKSMPEEINRIVTDRVSKLLFAPTDLACRNLTNEGAPCDSIFNVGDVMYDVVRKHSKPHHGNNRSQKLIEVSPKKKYILVTVHRAENTESESRLSNIVSALLKLSQNDQVVWPLHPRTEIALKNLGLFERVKSGLDVLPPLSYIQMMQLQQGASVIATDSGGVQKEAYFHKVPCVTLRDETEWQELVDNGWNRIASPQNSANVVANIRLAFGSLGTDIDLYGNGSASKAIRAILEKFLS